jgi:NADPH2:quinone reductase
VEAVVVNGITAYQMLHRSARVRPGQTILVHGASGGVGVILCQLARHAGIRVIGTAAPRNHEALRALGVEPIDYRDPDLGQRVREFAPDGVDAVFDHLGPESFPTSFSLLAAGGTLVAYGSAAKLDDNNSMLAMFVGMLARLYTWNLLPNKRRANFYNFWAGHSLSIRKFRQRQHADLTAVLDLLRSGVLTPQIAATFPLTEAAAALALAESRSTSGKIVLLP